MKTYTAFDNPIKVFGIPFFEERKSFARLPDELIARLPNLEHLGRRSVGARLAFKTDSPTFTVKVVLKTMSVDLAMSIYACQSAQVMLGERENARHLGVINPPDYDTKISERTFVKSSEMEEVTVYFPRNEQIETIEISIEDGATIAEPTPYKHSKPVVFYGSSITEGGCSCSITNAYNAILSRWLDFDYYNLGFSGNAFGELAMADFINTLDLGVFVYDYDHNAPTVSHLAKTHKPFYERIREAHPNLPILMMSCPAEVYSEENIARRDIIKATYDDAVAAGDKNVYYIDGETLYGETDRNLCSMDVLHPNDFGFYRMASVIRPILKQILDGTTAG